MKNELKKVISKLRVTECGTKLYDELLSNASTIAALVKEYGDIVPVEDTDEEQPDPMDSSIEEHIREHIQEHIAAEESRPIISDEVAAELDMETVREIVAEASKNGVSIKNILTKYVPEGKPIKFSSIPASSYKDLVEDINNAG